jgi:hypothetical protein
MSHSWAAAAQTDAAGANRADKDDRGHHLARSADGRLVVANGLGVPVTMLSMWVNPFPWRARGIPGRGLAARGLRSSLNRLSSCGECLWSPFVLKSPW